MKTQPGFVCLIFLGLCLEKLPVSSSTSNLHVDREQDVITCYEKAGDIALLYLQEIERVSEDQVFLPVNFLKISNQTVESCDRSLENLQHICLWVQSLTSGSVQKRWWPQWDLVKSVWEVFNILRAEMTVCPEAGQSLVLSWYTVGCLHLYSRGRDANRMYLRGLGGFTSVVTGTPS